jgi:hypothetical protein
MPLIKQMFDDQIRFRLTKAQKRRLYAEASRRQMSGADLLREFIDSLPQPKRRYAAMRGWKDVTSAKIGPGIAFMGAKRG